MTRPSSSLQSCSLFFLLQVLTAVAFAQMPALCPLPGTGSLSAPANPQKFTFVLAGDNRPAGKTCKQPPVPGKIFNAVKTMNPSAAFVLWTGDTISGKNPDSTKLQSQYQEFLGIAATANVPVFNAPGNHEMDDKDNQPNEQMKDFYRAYMAGTYGAFTYGNSRFIALDSENGPGTKKVAGEISMAEGQPKPKAPGAITKKQLNLLAADLEANKKLDNIFIFMHHPVFPYDCKDGKGKGCVDGLDPASVTALQALFAKYNNVSYIISGHQHLYYAHQKGTKEIDPPPSRTAPSQPPVYLVSGGAGAPLKQDTTGSFFHYLIFNVDGAKVVPNLVKIGSCVACQQSDDCDPCKLSEKDEKKKGGQMCLSLN